MNGIVFFKTQILNDLRQFYIGTIGCELWLDQGDCLIFKHGNMLLGFCERDEIDTNGIITFFYEDEESVDQKYAQLKTIAISKPSKNLKYNIYNFFARDPENRQIEFQHFLDKNIYL
jgi:hypothetical protein